jgi:hypothetical protein
VVAAVPTKKTQAPPLAVSAAVAEAVVALLPLLLPLQACFRLLFLSLLVVVALEVVSQTTVQTVVIHRSEALSQLQVALAELLAFSTTLEAVALLVLLRQKKSETFHLARLEVVDREARPTTALHRRGQMASLVVVAVEKKTTKTTAIYTLGLLAVLQLHLSPSVLAERAVTQNKTVAMENYTVAVAEALVVPQLVEVPAAATVGMGLCTSLPHNYHV